MEDVPGGKVSQLEITGFSPDIYRAYRRFAISGLLKAAPAGKNSG
jgi:hypothetical protein